jgi:hypothetical protein
LQRGTRTRLHVDVKYQTYAYAREWEGETAVIIFNLGYLFQIIPLPNAENYDCLISTGTLPVLEENRVMIAAGTAVLIVNCEL